MLYCGQCRISPTMVPPKMLTTAQLMVIYKKRFRRYASSRSRKAFKTKYSNCTRNFGRTTTSSQVLRFGGQNTFLGRKEFNIYHTFETIFLSTTKFGGHKKDFGETAPECPTVSAVLGRTVARKSSTGGLHVCAGGLDILIIYF